MLTKYKKITSLQRKKNIGICKSVLKTTGKSKDITELGQYSPLHCQPRTETVHVAKMTAFSSARKSC